MRCVRAATAANRISGEGIALRSPKWFSGNQKESKPRDSAVSACAYSVSAEPSDAQDQGVVPTSIVVAMGTSDHNRGIAGSVCIGKIQT